MNDKSNTQAAKPISVERVDALRLADELKDMTCLWSPSDNRDRVERAAAELRRLAAQPAAQLVGYADPTMLSELAPGKTATVVHKDDAHLGAPGAPDDVPLYLGQPAEQRRALASTQPDGSQQP